jgi:hypothetical protein
MRAATLTVFSHHCYQSNDVKLPSDTVKGETTIFAAAPGDNCPWFHEFNPMLTTFGFHNPKVAGSNPALAMPRNRPCSFTLDPRPTYCTLSELN